tara:strand:+ start:269 stop:517 length:249 start_codon:yes stop_codon:yes gene_type:complete
MASLCLVETKKYKSMLIKDRVSYGNSLANMGLFMYLLYKKDKKVFNLFTEPIYQRIEKDEKQEKMGLWVFVLVIIILIIIFW